MQWFPTVVNSILLVKRLTENDLPGLHTLRMLSNCLCRRDQQSLFGQIPIMAPDALPAVSTWSLVNFNRWPFSPSNARTKLPSLEGLSLLESLRNRVSPSLSYGSEQWVKGRGTFHCDRLGSTPEMFNRIAIIEGSGRVWSAPASNSVSYRWSYAFAYRYSILPIYKVAFTPVRKSSPLQTLSGSY